jgi:DNA-binding NarL/FixJ family response regulator
MTIRVYLGDDHAVVRDGLRALLESNPEIQVVGDAENGRKALQEVEALQPDVIVLDVSMPEIGGIEVAEQIAAADFGTKVIMLSMFGTPELVNAALRAGARGYLLKESAGREVVDATLAVYAGRYYFSEAVLQTLVTDYLQVGGASPRTPLDSLSEREREVLQYVVKGWSSARIAAHIHLSVKTVETYRSRMMQKLGVSDMANLTKLAIRLGLTSID